MSWVTYPVPDLFRAWLSEHMQDKWSQQGIYWSKKGKRISHYSTVLCFYHPVMSAHPSSEDGDFTFPPGYHKRKDIEDKNKKHNPKRDLIWEWPLTHMVSITATTWEMDGLCKLLEAPCLCSSDIRKYPMSCIIHNTVTYRKLIKILLIGLGI